MKPRAQTKISPHGILSAAGALACGGTIAGFFDFYWWPIEMVSPFRLQFAFGLTALAAMFAWWRSGKAATVFSLFALANVAVVFVALPMGNHRPSPAGPGLRAVLLNVHTENRRHDLVQAFLTQCDADLIVLEEVNSVWISRLAGLLKTHPHSVIEAREDNFGIALFSKLPIDRFEILDLGEVGVPSIAARVVVEGRTLQEIALFISEKLSTIKGVISTATRFRLKAYKENGVSLMREEKGERLAVTP